MRPISIFLALSLAVAAAGTASAQTMSYADAVDQLARACGTDLAKYCKGIELGGRLKTCLDANQAGCRRNARRPAPPFTTRSRDGRGAAQYRRHLRPGYCETVRHLACRRASRGMPAQRVACGDEPAMQSNIHRYRLAHGKGTAMRRHQIYAAAALLFASGLTAAVAQNAIGSTEMANSLALLATPAIFH